MYRELRNHIIALSKSNLRLDGRKVTEYRQPLKVEKSVFITGEGTAKATIGETEVLCGIKAEIGSPFPDKQDEGTIMVGSELLPLSNPEFESGPPGIQSIELARVVDRAIRESKAIDFKTLCVKEGEKVWLIVIDIITLNDAGNLFDAAALAAMAALQDFKFPKLDEEYKVNYEEKTDKGLKMNNTPVSVTVCKIGDSLLVDPTTEEEKAIDARLTVAILEDNTLCALQKGGDEPLTDADIDKMIDLATEKSKELRKVLKNA